MPSICKIFPSSPIFLSTGGCMEASAFSGGAPPTVGVRRFFAACGKDWGKGVRRLRINREFSTCRSRKSRCVRRLALRLLVDYRIGNFLLATTIYGPCVRGGLLDIVAAPRGTTPRPAHRLHLCGVGVRSSRASSLLEPPPLSSIFRTHARPRCTYARDQTFHERPDVPL